MMSAQGTRFSIEPADDGWRWTTYDLAGGSLDSGQAATKREAAAFVIQRIVRAILPDIADPMALPAQREAA
ncbi:MAG TPA: hypothetical protein VEA44_11120 [Caulobacter sp.]|nr:hypothetical protein [Caulobacter sp.]